MQERMKVLMSPLHDESFDLSRLCSCRGSTPLACAQAKDEQLSPQTEEEKEAKSNNSESSNKDLQPESKKIVTTTNSNNYQHRDLLNYPFGNDLQWRPVWDVTENEKQIVVHVELPGVERDNLSLKVEHNILTVSGEKKQETNKQEKKEEDNNNSNKYHRIERSYGKFSRSMRLPEGVDHSAISANYNDGVLTVTIPKPPQAACQGPLMIEIQHNKTSEEGSASTSTTIGTSSCTGQTQASTEPAPPTSA